MKFSQVRSGFECSYSGMGTWTFGGAMRFLGSDIRYVVWVNGLWENSMEMMLVHPLNG